MQFLPPAPPLHPLPQTKIFLEKCPKKKTLICVPIFGLIAVIKTKWLGSVAELCTLAPKWCVLAGTHIESNCKLYVRQFNKNGRLQISSLDWSEYM